MTQISEKLGVSKEDIAELNDLDANHDISKLEPLRVYILGLVISCVLDIHILVLKEANVNHIYIYKHEIGNGLPCHITSHNMIILIIS